MARCIITAIKIQLERCMNRNGLVVTSPMLLGGVDCDPGHLSVVASWIDLEKAESDGNLDCFGRAVM